MCHLGGRRYRKRNSQKDKWEEKEGEEREKKKRKQGKGKKLLIFLPLFLQSGVNSFLHEVMEWLCTQMSDLLLDLDWIWDRQKELE